MFAVTLALDYLDFNDKPFNLLRVNKEWNRTLERKVYRLVLRTADEKLKMPTRLKIWKILIKLVLLLIIFFIYAVRINLILLIKR